MPTVELHDGRRASYEVIGDGPRAMMLPGGPGFDCAYMRSTAELFADTWQSYLVDPHGSGGSSPPLSTDDYSPGGHARFYDEVRSALGLEAVTVVGHSFGATTALSYAALYPESTQRCIAVAAFGVGLDQDADEGGAAVAEMEAMLARHAGAAWYPQARATWDGWTERMLATDDPHEAARMMASVMPLYTAHPDRPDVSAALDEFSADLRCDLAAMKAWENGLYQRVDLRPLLGRVRAPTMLVVGELDLICGPAQASPIHALLPAAALATIPDCGHMPTIEASGRFRSEVLSWLERTS
jgi:proline iminopeptidase